MNKLFYIILLLLFSIEISGCYFFGTDSGTSNQPVVKTFPNAEGSIIPGSGIDISKIKVGLFFRSHESGISSARLDFDATKGRLYYHSVYNAGSAVQFYPSFYGMISPTGEYFINLPSANSLNNGDVYFLIAWHDSDDDGRLDLITEAYQGAPNDPTKPVLSHAHEGEYNRGPIVNLMIGSAPTDVWVGYFQRESGGTENYEFKYYGVDPFFDDQEEEVLTQFNNTGFNFSISSTVDPD